jgi:hypothetical protein
MTSVHNAPTLGGAQVAEQIAAISLDLDDEGRPDCPIAFVDVTRPVPGVAVDAARRSQIVLIGLAHDDVHPANGELCAALACTLARRASDRTQVAVQDVAAAAAQIAAAVSHSPRAAITLAGLLQLTTSAGVREALIAESLAYSMLLAGSEFAQWRAATLRRSVPHFDTPAVLVERTGDELDVIINRPARRNAFSTAVRDGLVEAFDLVAHDAAVTRVRLSGAGPAFCSGGDLDEFGTSRDVSTAHLIRLDRSVAARVDRCRDRVTAVVHGACVGAGIEIPSFAGTVLARADAWFQLPELAMGLIPGAGGTVGITRRIGRWRTAYLSLTGDRLGVDAALDWGLVDGRATD